MRLAYATFFGLQDRTLDGFGFTVRTMRADPDRIVQRHAHDGAHAIAVLSGKYLSLASIGAPLRAAAIVYNPHGVEHADSFDGGDGAFLAISFDPEVFPALPGETPLPGTLNQPAALKAVFRLLDRCCGGDPQELEASVLQIAACGTPRVDDQVFRDPPRWARDAYDRLRSGDVALSVAELARTQGMHPVAFSRAFRRYFGASPMSLAMEARLHRSAQDLARGRASIAGIGLKSGFFDQAHFSRLFRKRYGATPGQFRRAFQG
jgi:AraC family transcriptional regulator